MGTLGRYLQDARQARGIDLRDAAQQTRISINFLKALEEEDFSKLPGKVFVRGFLKSYAKFLRLDESEVMTMYEETGQKPSPAAVPVPPEPSETEAKQSRSAKIPIEPFLWGTGIVVLFLLFLFTAVPKRPPKETRQAGDPAGRTELSSTPVPTSIPVKLYLEVVALENTWVLVRTDTSPQKKAVLNKGESLIWSASERFLLSCGSAGAVKLLLNGQELTLNEPKDAVIRDLTITASGIVDRKIPTDQSRPAKPKPQPAAQARPAEQVPSSATITGGQQASEPVRQPQIQPQQQPHVRPQQQQQQPQLPQPLAPAPRNLL